MEIEQFRQLVYAKGFDTTLTQKLLGIADSSMVKELILEDLLDLIWEYAEYTYDASSGSDYPDPEDNCDTCTVGDDAESARERAVNERDLYEKINKSLKRGICDVLENYRDINDPMITLVVDQIERKCTAIEPIVEPTGDLGINVTAPMHLMHMKCECGKELYIEGKGWTIDFQGGPVVFKCSCGRTFTLPGPEPVVLCTACEAADKNNPSCDICDRPMCPECEADNTDDLPCALCERNRPHA